MVTLLYLSAKSQPSENKEVYLSVESAAQLKTRTGKRNPVPDSLNLEFHKFLYGSRPKETQTSKLVILEHIMFFIN